LAAQELGHIAPEVIVAQLEQRAARAEEAREAAARVGAARIAQRRGEGGARGETVALDGAVVEATQDIQDKWAIFC
jgi:hypothetical protein